MSTRWSVGDSHLPRSAAVGIGDRLRDVHRALRDYYAHQAEQLTAALIALQNTAAVGDEGERHLADQRAELARLGALAEQAVAIRTLYI